MTDAPLITRFDAVLSDLDGVVYAGPHAIPGAVEALRRLAEFDVALGYVTNNASRSPAAVAAHLRELGAPAEDEQLVSSAQAGAALLAEHLKPGARVLITGSKALAHEVSLVGLTPITAEDGTPDAVVQGFDPGLGWRDLAEASYAVAGGAFWVATNTDMSIPQARGFAPGNGTLVAAVRAATGKSPLVAGKPEAPLFHTAARRLGSARPLVVGDRLDTDVLGGNNAGMATAVVLTGVDTFRTILAAPTPQRPAFLLKDLGALFEPYPEVVHDDGVVRCGGASAEVSGDGLKVGGSEDDINAWRAACAAWWSHHRDTRRHMTPEIAFTG